MAKTDMLAAAYLSVDGALFIKRLMRIEWMPEVLALLDNVYYAADQAIVDDHTVPQLVEGGLVDIDGTVEPSLAKWMKVLAGPDIIATLRAMNEDRMRRAVVARRGDDHVLALRRNEEVVIQSVWSAGNTLDDVVASPLWNALRVSETELAPEAAELDTITLTLDDVRELSAIDPHDRRVAIWLRDHGVDKVSAKVLAEVATYSGQRAEIAIEQNQGVTTFKSPVGVGVADTSAGRVVSSVRQIGSQYLVTFGPGSYARFKTAIADLVAIAPAKNWFSANGRK